MARVSHVQSNFTAGELSPRLEGRIDFAKYFNGAARLENMTVMPHGGATKRPGFRYVAAARDAARKSRLIPFEFSVEQAYAIELAHGALRFFKDGGAIVDGDPPVPVEVAAPWDESELFAVQTAQSADVLYLVHPNHAPRKLSRASHVDWTLEEAAFADGPYLDANATATALRPSAERGTVAIAASGTDGVNGGRGFLASDVGRLVSLKHGAGWGWARIAAVAGATRVTAEVRRDFRAAAATTEWRLGLWSDTTGWPATATFYEQRLILAGGRDHPQRVDGSKVGDFEVFTPGVGDDDPIAFTLAAERVNAILWMSAGQSLMIGTTGGEWRMRGASADAAITPGTVQVKRQTTYGGAAMAPVRVGAAVLFLQRAGRKVRELTYSFEADGFVAPDLTLLAEHLATGAIVDMAWQQEPNGVLWCARDDGVLLAMTYDRGQDVVAWHRHVLGGTDAAVESVCAIPCPADGEDRLWIAARRTVNGATRRGIETMARGFRQETDRADAFHVDSGLTYDGRRRPAAALTFAATSGAGVAAEADAAAFDAVSPSGDAGNAIAAGGGRARIAAVESATRATVDIVEDLSTPGPHAAGDWVLERRATAVSGLDHLEGERVAVLADGASLPPATVSGGRIALGAPAARVQAGLPYAAAVATLPVETVAARGGSVQGRRKRIHRLALRLWRSLGLRAGTREGALDDIPFRSAADAMDGAPALFTGDMRVALRGGWNREGRVLLEQATPQPLTILACAIQLSVHEP